MYDLRQVGVVFQAEWRRTVQSARVVVLLLLFAMFSVLALLIVGSIANAIDRQIATSIAQGVSPDQARQAFDQARHGLLGFLFSNDPEAIRSLAQIPIVVLVVFRLTLIFLPLYIALMGFDQLSGEIGPKSIRYLLVRTPRSTLLFGKYLGQAAVLISLVLLIDFAILVYARLTHSDFGTALAALTLLRLWIAAIVYSLAYLALTSLCSALFRVPAVSLVFNVVMLFAFWLVEAIGQSVTVRAQLLEERPSAWAYLRYLSPSHYGSALVHPSFTRYGPAGAAYAGFALLFLALGYFSLRGRDL